MLTNLHIQILNFAKSQYFHGTLAEFINYYGVPENDALAALKTSGVNVLYLCLQT